MTRLDGGIRAYLSSAEPTERLYENVNLIWHAYERIWLTPDPKRERSTSLSR